MLNYQRVVLKNGGCKSPKYCDLDGELGDGWEDLPIGSMYGIYDNIWGILMVNVTIYSIHGSYGLEKD